PSRPSAGSPVDEGSSTSSDDDTEGLRRRQRHQPQPETPTFTPAPPRETPNPGAEDGLSVSKYLLGALALVAVGLLVITGEGGGSRGRVASPGVPSLLSVPSPQDSQQKLPPPDTKDPQSVHSVSLLLDKLAKENQEIRLMQAELQAHKAELQALLQRSEGAAAAAGAQQQALAAENARLRAALEQEAAALRDAHAELQRLREAGSPGNPKAGDPAAKRPPPPPTGTPSPSDAAAAQREG
ncbi:PBIP1 protein, partial [Crotophaga sulcirostris]|nr:PBIP1 protein [Crotophaga sulcirostris]